MGRVSDALRRATVENKSPISQIKDELTVASSLTNGKDHSANGQGHLTAQAVDDHKNRQDGPNTNVLSQPADNDGQVSHDLLHENDSKLKRGLRRGLDNLLLGRARKYLKSHPLPALDQGSIAGEQYKILREQIKKITGENKAYILAVTSPTKGDGKSTVAANLAAAIVLKHEHRVLLIDGDLRSPSLHESFGIKSVPGLVEYLSANSSADLSNYVQSTTLSGLQIWPAGKPSAHSSELLATEKMKTLVREMPVLFPGHLVIVDTPPVLSTSDTLVLAQQVDGVIMVIRSGKTPRACLTEAIKIVGGDKVIGVVLNGAEMGTASKYYYSSAPNVMSQKSV